MSGPYGYGLSAPSYDPGAPPFEASEEETECPDCAKLREQLVAATVDRRTAHEEALRLGRKLREAEVATLALLSQLASAETREKALRDTLEELAEWGLSADDVVAIARSALANTGGGEGDSNG